MSQTQGSGACCQYDGCTERAWSGSQDGFCKYHSPANGRVAREVWQEARSRACNEQGVNLQGWCFPKDPDAKGFADVVFEGEANFRDARFAGGMVAHFEGARFESKADFHRARFEDAAWFYGARFQKKADFSRARFCFTASFTSCPNADAHKARSRVVFGGDTDFSRAVFETAADFNQAKFLGDVRFQWVEVRRNARFRNTIFVKEADFRNADFEGNVFFQEGEFRRRAKFQWVSYKAGRNVVFDPPAHKGKPFVQCERGESAYRLAKQAAFARRELHEADLYGYYESRAQAPAKPKWKRALAAPLAGGHWCLIWLADQPWRLGVFALLVIVGCGFLYATEDAVAPSSLCQEQLADHDTQWPEAIHFSVVTFTALGYGDLQPKPDGWFKFAADAEAALGVLMTALFIVLVTRKFLA